MFGYTSLYVLHDSAAWLLARVHAIRLLSAIFCRGRALRLQPCPNMMLIRSAPCPRGACCAKFALPSSYDHHEESLLDLPSGARAADNCHSAQSRQDAYSSETSGWSTRQAANPVYDRQLWNRLLYQCNHWVAARTIGVVSAGYG